MKVSDQAVGAIMMALQKCIAEQCDIVPLLKDFDFELVDDKLVVSNPPVVQQHVEKEDNGQLDFFKEE